MGPTPCKKELGIILREKKFFVLQMKERKKRKETFLQSKRVENGKQDHKLQFSDLTRFILPKNPIYDLSQQKRATC